jgi:predicted esterase
VDRQLDRNSRSAHQPLLRSAPGTISPAPLLIALHGYGANKRQIMREAKLMTPETFAIASLQGFHQHIREPRETAGPLRFGFGWLTNFKSEESVAVHHRALLDLMKRSLAEGVADPARVFLLGFSQSCALNYRFAFTHPERLRGVVGICGGIPGDWETSNVYRQTQADVFHLAGTRDEILSARTGAGLRTAVKDPSAVSAF